MITLTDNNNGTWTAEISAYNHRVFFSKDTEADALAVARQYHDEAILPEVQRDYGVRLIEQAERTVDNLVAQYPSTERDGWAEKVRIARLVQSNEASEADTALFTTLAELRGDADAETFAKRVIVKAESFTSLSYTIHEIKNKALKDIDAAEDEDTIRGLVEAAETAMNTAIEGGV